MWRGTRWRPMPSVLVGTGFVVQVVAGFSSAKYQPPFIDPDDPLPCGCAVEEAASALARLWVVIGVGAALVVVGLALLFMQLDRVPRRPARPVPTPLHAAAVAAAGVVVPAALFLGVFFALFVSTHLVPAVALGIGLAHAAAVAGLDRLIGPAWSSMRRSWGTGVVAGGLATLALAEVFWAQPSVDSWSPAFVDGAVLGLVVLAGRTVLAPRGSRSRPGIAVGALAAVAAASFVVVSVAEPDLFRPQPERYLADSPPAAPTTEPPAPTTSPPAPETTTAPPPVEADVACAQADLRFVVTGWDAALGARFAAVQATNAGARPCWVAGVPAATLLQGGRPLTLTIEPAAGPAVEQRVGIAPGGTAFAQLDWRTYAGRADDTTPQSVTVALAPGEPPVDAEIVGGPGPAPFDLADGGTWGIAAWAPPWN